MAKTPYHRMAVDSKDGAFIAGAAGLRGMTPKAFVEAELVPLARKIIRQAAPLASDYVPGPWQGREGIKYVSLDPKVFELLNKAVAVEVRHHKAAGRRGKFTLKQLTEKYLVPIARETVRQFGREVEESQKKAA